MNTAIVFHTGFNDGKCNRPMYEGMKEKTKHDTQVVFLSDESLKGYTTSDLTLRFLDGHKIRAEYELSCYDESKQEVEGSSSYCMRGVQSRLGELGHHIGSTSSEAEKMGMGWLDELGSMVFR